MFRNMEFWDCLIHHQGPNIFPTVSKKKWGNSHCLDNQQITITGMLLLLSR